MKGCVSFWKNVISNSEAGINFRGFSGGSTYLNRAAFTNPPVFAGGQNVVARLGTVGPYLPNVLDRYSMAEDIGLGGRVFEHRLLQERPAVDGVDALHDRLKSTVKIVMPIVTQFYGMREFAIEDPDGYVITFAERVP